MVVRKVWLAPVLAVVTGTSAMVSGYVIGVFKDHFPAVMPLISDGGALPPESCVFGQLTNISAFFLLLTFYIRHRQTVEYYGHRLQMEGSIWRICSLFLLWVGIIMTFGVTVVACFPESELKYVHSIGALILFLAAIVYIWGQVFIGFLLIPRMASQYVNVFRLLIAIVATVFMVLHQLTLHGHIFVAKNIPAPKDGWHGIKWYTKDSPYYWNHTICAISEWVMIMSVQLFVLSFVAELRFAYAHVPRVIFRRSDDDTGFSQGEARHVKIVHIQDESSMAGPSRHQLD